MRSRAPSTAALLGLALAFAVPTLAVAPAGATEAQERLLGYVEFDGADEQPMGMSEKDLKKFIDVDLEKKPRKIPNFENTLWPQGLLYATPAHTVPVAPFSMARHELTNAQWLVFLNSTRNSVDWEVGLENAFTLRAIISGFYGIDPEEAGTAYQHAWLTTYYSNEELLQPIFNPEKKEDPAGGEDEPEKADDDSSGGEDDMLVQDGDDEPVDGAGDGDDEEPEGDEDDAEPEEEKEPEWDTLFARADEITIPKGTPIRLYDIPIPQVGFAKNGTVKEGRAKAPVNYVSWEDCVQFCLWAGLHIPTEAEWEHAARGIEGRRFAWGNDWITGKAVFKGSGELQPLLVDQGDGMETETPNGALRHLAGNVHEWVLEPFRLYAGHAKKAHPYDRPGHSVSARGGSFVSDDYTMFAADRVWDATQPLGSKSRVEGFGFRPAAYAQPMKDHGVLVAMNFNDFSGQGPRKFVPPPLGIPESSVKDPSSWIRTDPKTKREPLIGIDADRTTGWLKRQTQDDSGGDHVYITGPAQGVGFIPVKGMQSAAVKGAEAFKKATENDKQICFVGVLIGTANATLQLENFGGEPVTVSFSDQQLQYVEEKVGYEYPLGAFVVLRGDRVAVYAPNGSSIGTFGKHMAWDREPLGYLPPLTPATEDKEAVPAWSHTMVEMKGADVSASKNGDVYAMTTVIAPLTDKGVPKGGGAKGVALTLHVKTTFDNR